MNLNSPCEMCLNDKADSYSVEAVDIEVNTFGKSNFQCVEAWLCCDCSSYLEGREAYAKATISRGNDGN